MATGRGDLRLIGCTAPFKGSSVPGLQVALLGVTAGVQPPVLIQSLGPVGFIVDVMSDLLQILEVGPGGADGASTSSTFKS